MTEEPKLKCYLCDHPGNGWEPLALKWVLASFKVCKKHTDQITEKLKDKKEEVVEQVIEKPKSFLPPIPARPFKDYTERESNDGSLIE